MAGDLSNVDSCRCHCVAKRRIRFPRLSCTSIILFSLLFACTQAQQVYKAQLSEHPDAEQESSYPIPPGAIKKDASYFWTKTQEGINSRAKTYDESVDPITEGMQNERNAKEQEYYYYGNQYTEYYDYSNMQDTPVKAAYEVPYDDQEISDYTAEEKRPCRGGKSCAPREEARALWVDSVKRNILQQLKLKAPPNITVPKISLDSPPIRRILKQKRRLDELELEIEDEEYEEDETKREKVISYARAPVDPEQTGSYFRFTEDDLRHTVTSAVIWIYIKANPTQRTNITLDFYHYRKNTRQPDSPHIAVKFDRKVIPIKKKAEWKSFSISNEVSRWFTNPESNLGIDIRCPEIPGIVMSQPKQGHEDKKPMLEVDLTSNLNSRRKKRDAGALICNEESREERCCKYDFEIDFRAMGWDWIINPNIYRSYHCAGECPVLFLQTNQHKVLAMHSGQNQPKAASPCCAPTKMAPMSMLYFDNEENIIYSDVPDMIVKRCGCM
ncbi:growth/differentiation factor 8-like [Styela clava]